MNASTSANTLSHLKRRRGLAIASLVLGTWGLVIWGLVIWVMILLGASVPSYLLAQVAWLRDVLGLVLGISALVKINRNHARYTGKRIAIAGIITNSASIIIGILFIATGRVPWYL